MAFTEGDMLSYLGNRAAAARAEAHRARLETDARASALMEKIKEEGRLISEVLAFVKDPFEKIEWIANNTRNLNSSDGVDSLTVVLGKNAAVVTLRSKDSQLCGFVSSWIRRFDPKLRNQFLADLKQMLEARSSMRDFQTSQIQISFATAAEETPHFMRG